MKEQKNVVKEVYITIHIMMLRSVFYEVVGGGSVWKKYFPGIERIVVHQMFF